jgi:hypothetical protein
MDPAEFLAARLGEMEAAALESKNAPAGASRFVDADQWSEPLIWLTGDERMLRDVAAKRAILTRHAPVTEPGRGTRCGWCSDEFDVPWPCEDALSIAAIDSDHPDYNPEWKP